MRLATLAALAIAGCGLAACGGTAADTTTPSGDKLAISRSGEFVRGVDKSSAPAAAKLAAIGDAICGAGQTLTQWHTIEASGTTVGLFGRCAQAEKTVRWTVVRDRESAPIDAKLPELLSQACEQGVLADDYQPVLVSATTTGIVGRCVIG